MLSSDTGASRDALDQRKTSSLPASGQLGRIKVGWIVALAILFLIGFGAVYVVATGMLASYLSGGLTPSTYGFEGVTYNLQFYTNAVEESSNAISSLTHGGKQPLSNPAEVVASPVLGKYGTGMDMFIVPTKTQPVLAHGLCSDRPQLHTVFSVPMSSGYGPAIVCSLSAPGTLQSEYLVQFSHGKSYYDGFIQLTFDWAQVTASKASAQAFEHYASLTRYNNQIKSIVGSITVK